MQVVMFMYYNNSFKGGNEMIKVMKITNTDADTSDYKVELFADTKNEVTSDAHIVGLPEGTKIEIGSSVLTASGELAFMKSDGTWNWL